MEGLEFETVDLRALTVDQFESLGAEDMAYVRYINTSEGWRWALMGGDGSPLATADTKEAAEFAAQHLDRTQVTLH